LFMGSRLVSKWWSPWFLAVLVLSTGVLSADYGTGSGRVRDVVIPAPGDVGPDVVLADPGCPLSPPPNPEVGDSWVWWLWVHDPMPPHFEQHVCTVRGKSDRGYVVVRDLEWNVSIDQSDVDAILETWENTSIGPYPEQGIYEIDSLSFGEPPDELDNDPRIYLVWFDFVISADGFFFWFDQYPEGAYPSYHSNECEVLYLNTMSQGGPSGEYMLAVASHEFEHMIHWKYDGDEDSWVDEGMAELAMYFYGNPDMITGFNSNPDNDLTVWDGNWSDYIQTYLWSLYFFERYGGHPAVYAVVHEPANSVAGYNAVLDDFGFSEDFDDVFADWVVANYLDDTDIADGRYGYLGEDLPPFNVAGSYSSYPTVDVQKTVNHWAADYYRFQNIASEGLTLSFDGSDDNSFAVRALALRAGDTPEVMTMELDQPSQSGSVFVSGLSDPDDQVVLVVAGASGSGGNAYLFSAFEGQGTGGTTPGPFDLQLLASPVPSSDGVCLELSWTGHDMPAVEVYDASGRMVRTLIVGGSQGNAPLVWDGRNADGCAAPAGIYFARATLGNREVVQRVVLLR
jgi:hypothetical protein